MAFHFFTEPSKLVVQNENQSFGAIDINNYRLGNMFTAVASTTPKAFAVTDGVVLAQKIGGSNKISLVLKPITQPNLGLPKIDYIIYKGIKESSLVAGALIASSGNNDLTRIIHESATAWYGAKNPSESVPVTEPDAKRSLGLVYESTAVEPEFLKPDTALLKEAFFATNGITLPSVFGGNFLGEFDNSGDFGIVVVFEKIGFEPTFKLARELDSKLEFTALPASPSPAGIFERKHKKEQVLAFFDSAALFGSFYQEGLLTYDNTNFDNKSGDSLYNDVVSKFFNKNKLYFDIRNDYDDSFNYYENYGDNISWNLSNTSVLVDVNYYRNHGWPLLTVDDGQTSSEFDIANTDKIVKLSFTSTYESMLIYYKKVFKKELDFSQPNENYFYSPTAVSGKFAIEDLKVPKVVNRSVSNYFQIKILTNLNGTNATPPVIPPNGFSLKKDTYLDNLFPMFDMYLPFDLSVGKSALRVYYDFNFVDKKHISNANYTSNIGIAKDSNYVTLISFPHRYNLNIKHNGDDKIPVSSMEGAVGSFFLKNLISNIPSIKLVKSQFVIGGVEVDYLKYVPVINPVENEIEPVTDVEPSVELNNFTFNDVSIISLTNAEYDTLLQLKNTEFTNSYKVYLGIENIITEEDDLGTVYTKFEYCLRGLKVDGSNNIIAAKVSPVTPIVAYTDKKINGIDYIRNYEESIGYDNYSSGSERYEDYFVNLQLPIKNIIGDFEEKLNAIDLHGMNVFKQIKSLVSTKALSLWQSAVSYVQSHQSQADDRPLYWARLKMASLLKSHPYFLGDILEGSKILPASELENLITIIEEKSRNYTGVDFSAAPNGSKKILITGFDPFFLNPLTENILQSNPSGCVCLSMHNTQTANNIGYIQGMIVPVRFRDFDSSTNEIGGPGIGIVEKYIAPFINEVDMIVTISQAGPNDYNIDKYATVTRGETHDNLNHNRTGLSRSIEIDDPSLEWIYTSLPSSFIVSPVQYDLTFYDSNGTFHDGVVPPVPGERMNYGPGGDYLSNEIFYRVAKLRVEVRPSLPTGHFHISKIQNGNDDFNGTTAQNLINIVKTAFNNAVTGL